MTYSLSHANAYCAHSNSGGILRRFSLPFKWHSAPSPDGGHGAREQGAGTSPVERRSRGRHGTGTGTGSGRWPPFRPCLGSERDSGARYRSPPSLSLSPSPPSLCLVHVRSAADFGYRLEETNILTGRTSERAAGASFRQFFG